MLGKRLREIRKKRKITQDEIATFLGVKRQTYSAYERSVSVPDAYTLKKLADFFSTSVDYFFLQDDETPVQAMTPQEKRLLILARKAEDLPPAQRERLFQNFEDNVAMFLEALKLSGQDE